MDILIMIDSIDCYIQFCCIIEYGMIRENVEKVNCLTAEIENKFEHLWHLVGNTPMLALHYTYKGKAGKIYVKCEHYNLTGSIKDRIALYTLSNAYRTGKIKNSPW